MSVQLFQIGQWFDCFGMLITVKSSGKPLCFPDEYHLTLNHSVNFQTRLSLHPQLD